MSLDEAISRLIGRIYDGVHDAAHWCAAMQMLRRRGEAHLVFVGAVDSHSQEVQAPHFYGPDDGRFLDGVSEYEAFFRGIDPAAAFAAQHPDAGFVDTRLLPGQGSRDFEDYMRWQADRLGTRHFHTRYTQPRDGLMFGIAFHPPAGAGGVGEAQARLHGLVFDHMARAVRIAARPPDWFSRQEAWLLIDRQGRIRSASVAAEMMLDSGDGLARGADGSIDCARSVDRARLSAAIRMALSALDEGRSGGEVAVSRPSGRRAWLLTVSPLPVPPDPWSALRPAALVHIVDPENLPQASTTRLQQLFGLTAREAELAIRLTASNGNLRETADRLGMAHATARVHLRRVFDKTGAASQMGLARLIGRLTA